MEDKKVKRDEAMLILANWLEEFNHLENLGLTLESVGEKGFHIFRFDAGSLSLWAANYLATPLHAIPLSHWALNIKPIRPKDDVDVYDRSPYNLYELLCGSIKISVVEERLEVIRSNYQDYRDSRDLAYSVAKQFLAAQAVDIANVELRYHSLRNITSVSVIGHNNKTVILYYDLDYSITYFELRGRVQNTDTPFTLSSFLHDS